MNLTNTKQLPPAPFEPWAVLDFWLRRWLWVAGWTVLLAVAGAFAARAVWKKTFTASAQLIHYAPSAVDDTFHPRDLATPSLVVMLQAQGLLQEIGSNLQPPMSAKQLSDRLEITLDRNNDVVSVAATGDTRDGTADLVNRFCAAAIAYTQAMQRREAGEAGDSVSRQLAEVEHEIGSTRASIPASSAATVVALAETSEAAPPGASDLPQRIQAAQEQLDDLLVRYTDAHPLVLEQRARLAALEELQRKSRAAAPAAGNHSSAPPPISPAFYGRITPEEIALGERLRSLESNRAILNGRQRAIQPFRDNPPGYFRVLRSAAENPILQHNHRLEIALCACLGAFLGLFGSAGQILIGEFMDNRIKSRADVRRVTGLPLLATLGDLKRLSPAGRDQWAFRAWTALQSRLSISPNHGMVCGITSANRGDGRSTWIELLSRAASACGFRVLTITAGPTAEPAPAAKRAGLESRDRSAGTAVVPSATPATVGLTTSILSTPGQIVDQLRGADCPPVVNIPLPGWVWNLERRKQWQAALEAWRAIENIVIFVELPPASVAESVLLAENVPNLLWLADSNSSDASDTITELETLRDARCNLVGAVLNRERATPVRGRFSRWMGNAALFIAAGLLAAGPKARAQDAFSVVGPAQRADWQQRLTLGPGDVLNFHMFGHPEMTREQVPVGPDGCVSYLEAENLPAAGLTVDEFRAKLNEELAKYRRAPQAFVTPVAYHSKKYYMLGNVVQKGIFPLDRPITIIEAVARSRGFESGVSGGDTVDTTDFAHSFIGRGGKRMPIDFERLFQHGDLSQNVALEPDDYLYFPTVSGGDVYVLGEIRTPGPVPCDPDASALSVIASRGGFTERAWKKRVLVVRGSMDHPQTFKVDIVGALGGQASNLALQPGDIVYVSSRPWIKAEELLDHAASAFVESAVVTWTGLNVGPAIFTRPTISQ